MPSTAIGLLVAWANQQDQWVRDVVAEVIAVRRGLSDGRIAEILDALLREKGLAEGAPPALIELIEPDAAESQYQALTLTTLSDVKNVRDILGESGIRWRSDYANRHPGEVAQRAIV